MKHSSKSRVGLKNKMNNGMNAEIIEYIRHDDISVRFENGVIVRHKRYAHFKAGNIKCPVNVNGHIGETVTHQDMTYTIVEWRRNSDIDFVDETGVKYEHKSYYRFKNNQSFKKYNAEGATRHVGERKRMNCGEYATILEYDTTTKKITIEFDDGTVRSGLQYSNFRTGSISKNKYNVAERTGETNIMSNGQKATIIAYRKNTDIDVEFEDGYKRLHTQYSAFKDGYIQNPNCPSHGIVTKGRKSKKTDFLHQKSVMNCGLKCEIIDALNSANLTVKFENGEIKSGVGYKEFTHGSVRPPSGLAQKYLNEIREMSNGQTAKILSYRNADDIDIQFEDGTIVEHAKYLSFQRGHIKNLHTANPKSKASERIGLSRTMNSGMKATIVRYVSASDYDVEFEDGAIVHSKNIASFYKDAILHPNVKKSYQQKETEMKVIGKRKRMNNGIYAAIISYNSAADVTIEFEDGERVNTTMYTFERGKVAHPSYVRGQESYNELFTADYFKQIGFRKAPKGSLRKIDKSFAGMEFDMFNPNISGHAVAIEYDGGYRGHTYEEDKLKNTLCIKNNITLIRIREPQLNLYTIDGIQMFHLSSAELGSFELKDTIKQITNFINDKFGTSFNIDFSCPAQVKTVDSFTRVGETRKMKNGMMATIVKYAHANSIDIQFEDGAITVNKQYGSFKKGSIAHPYYSNEYLKHIGKTKTMKNGCKATVITYRNHKDINIQFEDGVIKEHVTTESFNNGSLRYPGKGMDMRSCRHREERLGLSKTCKDGRTATIVAYTTYNDIVVQFNDGTEWKTSYKRFQSV